MSLGYKQNIINPIEIKKEPKHMYKDMEMLM
jgi:hypothetical protein